MRSRFAFGLVMIASCVVTNSGCTHMQLQKNTNRQAKSVSEIYEEQVLDNLAMFVCNAHSTPFFAVPASGTNQVSDNGKVDAGANAFTLRFWKFVSAGGSRQMNQSWGLSPVVDPGRLRLMQCAYQRAVGASADYCQQCCELETAFYGPKYVCNGPCEITCGWLQWSDCWKDVPKCCCKKYGHHCGTYVWVDPCYEHEFSKLVLKIADFASGSFASRPTKEVRFYLNDDGTPGTVLDHSRAVIANVGSGKSMEDIVIDLRIPVVSADDQIVELEQQLKELVDSGDTTDANKEDVRNLINSAEMRTPAIQKQGVRVLLPADNAPEIDSRRKDVIAGLKLRIEKLKRQREIEKKNPSVPEATNGMPPTFGPPTQFNNAFGGSLLDLQQRLNTVAPSRE